VAGKSKQSIYALAEELGVSTSTVSRVLNRREGIGDETRKRVLASAKAHGFRPQSAARQLTVAVVVDRLRYANSGGFVSSLLSCLVESLSKRDVAVELVTQHNLERLDTRLIDGVLALAWDDSTVELLRGLTKTPVVAINRMDVPEFSSVVTDHRRHGEMAVDCLAGRGHRRIAMVCEEPNNWGTQERIEGFTARLAAHGLSPDECPIAFTDHQPMYGLLRRLTTATDLTALFVANEDLGLEASYILPHVLGIRVPQDLSLLGMESARVSQFLSPPMTTLAQPLDELAEKALELLLERVGNKADQTPAQVVLETRLVERESVATLPA
jgi:LacI family transcriptional regulator